MSQRLQFPISCSLPHSPSPPCSRVERWPRWPYRYRHFHTSPCLLIDDHYAALGLQPGAGLSEIKKSFYSLSKTHHPDRNPQNQAEASKKFTAISDAYHVLSNPEQRERYDREMQLQRGGPRSYSSPSGGSGFSSGGRKASGLSKRRGTFRGQPPSFYRSGGWGASSEKREANVGEDARNAEARRRQGQEQEQPPQGPFAGTTGSWPFSRDPNDVSHFDRDGHFKTQSSVEEQLRKGRRRRRGVIATPDDMVDDDSAAGAIGRFIQVCGMLAVGVGLPVLFFAKISG